jgi:hypothetical protein
MRSHHVFCALASWLGLAASAAAPTVAHAHGGIPVTSRILRQAGGDTMYVPVVFWGVWVGEPGKPWTWICEEMMNGNRQRRMALSTDGAFYATDSRGLTVSTDHGCTWTNIKNSTPAGLRLTDVVTDPVDGATAWVSSADGGTTDADGGAVPAPNGLFVTHDHGATFAPVASLAGASARLFQSVRLSADAQTVYATSTASGAPFSPLLHRATDGGTQFTSLPIGNLVDGIEPYAAEVLAVDPRNAQVLYVRVFAPVVTDGAAVGRQALLRSINGGLTFTEIYKLDGITTPAGITRGIEGVTVDVARGRLLVATIAGLLAADDAGAAPTVTLAPTGGLSQSQCVDVHSSDVYACSSDYSPDFKAIGKSSDGAGSFSAVLEFVDTKGPVDCPKGTPVGDMCPFYWEMYGSQLGIAFPDLGGGDGGGGGGGGGCGCSVGGARASGLAAGAVALGLALALAFVLRKRA